MNFTRKQLIEMQYLVELENCFYIAKNNETKECIAFEEKPFFNKETNKWDSFYGKQKRCVEMYVIDNPNDNMIDLKEHVKINSKDNSLLISLLYAYIRKENIYPPEFEGSIIENVIHHLEKTETNKGNLELLETIKRRISIHKSLNAKA